MSKNVISNLGEITANETSAPAAAPTAAPCNMMAYTINIHPMYRHLDYMRSGSKWTDLLPKEQECFLKRVHTNMFRILRKYLEDDNMVAFEFTKKGETHSHGYFRYKQTYLGYEIHPITLQKTIMKWLNVRQKCVAFCRWVTDEIKWKDYMAKDLATSGFTQFKSTGEQIVSKTPSILRYLNVKPIEKEESDQGDSSELVTHGAEMIKKI